MVLDRRRTPTLRGAGSPYWRHGLSEAAVLRREGVQQDRHEDRCRWLGDLDGHGPQHRKPQRIPVIPLDHEGARYIVSTRGESQWVQNVRANPTVTIADKSDSWEYHATEVPTSGSAPIIAAYRVKAGKTVEAYWKQLPSAEDHPVFLLV